MQSEYERNKIKISTLSLTNHKKRPTGVLFVFRRRAILAHMKKYIIPSILAVASLGLTAVPAFAQTIGVTSASITTSPVVNATLAFKFTRNLSVGSSGDDVRMLQQFLNKTPITGTFGPLTLAAVKAFQKAHAVPDTGFVGVLTRAELNKALASTQVALPTIVKVTADRSVAGTATIMAKYDGGNEKPTVWFAYGATPTSMTLLSKEAVAENVVGTTSIVISNLGSGECWAQAYIKNSLGTSKSEAVVCSQ
jgi:peptidoglycan hydrolase-like protein with peptidoglycan-binding domain